MERKRIIVDDKKSKKPVAKKAAPVPAPKPAPKTKTKTTQIHAGGGIMVDVVEQVKTEPTKKLFGKGLAGMAREEKKARDASSALSGQEGAVNDAPKKAKSDVRMAPLKKKCIECRKPVLVLDEKQPSDLCFACFTKKAPPPPPAPLTKEEIYAQNKTQLDGIYRLCLERRRTDGSLGYRLSGHPKRQPTWMTASSAHTLNQERKRTGESGSWEPDAKLTMEDCDVPLPNQYVLPEESAILKRLSKQNEEIWWGRHMALNAKPERVEGEAPAPGERQDVDGVPMTAVIRWCGSQKWDKKKCQFVAEKLGLHPRPNTLQIQVRRGSKNEDLPVLNGAQQKRILDLAAEYK